MNTATAKTLIENHLDTILSECQPQQAFDLMDWLREEIAERRKQWESEQPEEAAR